ncbi:MAG: AAA family ATPase [Gemmatimonadota bacterium]|nr:MAG: AAA family ATPase [Gemmatimonadota bacterium]
MRELGPAALYRTYDPAEFDFETTKELEDLAGTVGQPRAVAAVEFAAGIARDGYNIFALGATGTGKHSLVRHYLERHAAMRPVPPDLCYVHNFDDPSEPHLLELPAGKGADYRRDMTTLAERLHNGLTIAFESEEYQTRHQVIEEEFKERPREELSDIEQRAKAEGLVLLRSPVGMAFAPMRDGEVMSGDEFRSLPEEEQKAIEAKVEAFQEEAQQALRQMPSWERERQERVHQLEREVTENAISNLLDELRKKYHDVPDVLDHLNAVRADVVEQARELVEPETPSPAAAMGAAAMGMEPSQGRPRRGPLSRYHVNLVVDNRGVSGAPVVYEDNPTYDNLVGRIEHSAQFGALTTDFSHIKAGALHRANGGYLMIDAHKLLRTPYAWDALKRALQARRLRIEPLGQSLSLLNTVSLQPEPLELQVQVVLLGEPTLYYLLCAHDPDFEELFKVASDFAELMDATKDNIEAYLRLLAMLARNDELRPFDRSAMARLLEHSTRLAGDRDKLTARVGMVHDVLREADYWARNVGAAVVGAAHVQQAIDAQIHRADRMRERVHEQIERGTVMIDVAGAKIGQINGLAVISLGNFSFGRPNRLTARVRMGSGNVVDIEREVELGGPLHSKGVLILASYLGAHYSPDFPLSLSASLVFEQSYSGVDGDSASAAELFALLSAIAEVPIRQDVAVTGSVNQHGEIQAIGGVNEKIEGFFDVCRARGLSGEQGVMIPAANVRHLMLRGDVVDAVASGRFHVYPIASVNEGIQLLTGMETALRDASGQYPEGSLNHLVEQRLRKYAEQKRAFSSDGKAGNEAEEPND